MVYEVAFCRMAICLDKAVLRGEIDNTLRGRVRGRVWLIGREDPVELELDGNAWMDVAGARVVFVNPAPSAQRAARALTAVQRGIAGDITISKKVKHATVDSDERKNLVLAGKPIPFEWRSAVYLEWFSETNGRVVIESAGFEIETTAFAWQMDEAEEQAQQLMNQHAMRDWLATIIQRPEPAAEDAANAFSEAAWEESLKQSDRLTLAHMEALEKYGYEDGEDEDESRVAFVMGWDHLLDALADESPQDGSHFADDGDDDETGEEWKHGDSDTERLMDEVLDEEEDLDTSFAFMDRERHPLVQRCMGMVMRILNELGDERCDVAGNEDDEGDNESSPLDRFVSNTSTIGGRLAGVLGASDYAEGIEAGHALAVLKRCLNWSNEALSGLNDLLADPKWEDKYTLLDEFKRELHAIRDGITDLRQEIREANPGV